MAGIALAIVLILFVVRFLFLKFFLRRDFVPQLWIAPRGLITVLLFFAIPNGMVDGHGEILDHYNQTYDYRIVEFDQGILLYTILITSLIMTVSLILDRGDKVKTVLMDSIKLKSEGVLLDKIEESLNESAHDQENPGSTEE